MILQEDLSLEDTEWAPVASFSGAFKGNGHTISDVSLVGAYSPAGFFGILEEGGSIQDLTIKGVVNPAGTQKTAGGLVGTNYGTIINCTFSGAVHGEEEAGGLVGRNETSGTIDHSTSRAMVSGAYSTGGIAGYNLGVITGCTNVGAVNSEYQESALDMEGLPATLLELVKKDMGDDLSNNISNVSSDTGGIAGRSSGLILSSANAGDVGYAHVGYNVGGIVGRTDGLISGCVNQGLVQGRKDVGGIAGQAEPYVELDLDQSTINRLRTELDTLHTMVNGAADDMDGSTSLLNTDLNTLNSQMDTAVQAARRLQEQGGDYFDEVADEVDRTGDLISDTFTRLEPVMDTGVDALDKMTTAVGQLKWVTAEMAAEMLTASTALAKASSGAHKASDALDSSKQGLEQISKGLDDLIASLPGKDDSGLSSAISTILGGYSSVSGDAVDDHIKTAISLLQVANSAMSILSLGSGMSGQMKLLTTGLGLLRSATLLTDDGQLASAGKQVTRAVGNMAGLATQIGTLLGNTANLVSEQGDTQMASALTSMSGALGNVGDRLGNLEDILDKLGFNTGNISSGNASIQAGLDSLSDAAQDLGKAADDFDKSLDILKTDSALTSATLGHMSASLGIMAEGMSGLTSMTSQAADIVIRQHIRVKAAQADALNARHSRRMFHQLRQARSGIFAIAGQADCRQHNFTVTGCRQAAQFFQNAYFAAAAHRAAGAGNHAISAAAVAAIFYLHKCAGVICKAVHRQFFKAFALLVRANVYHLGFLAVQHFLHILQNGMAVAGTRYHIGFFNFSGFFRERLRVTARQNCHRAGVFAFGAAQPFAAFLVAKVRHGAAVDHINIRTVFFFHYGKPILLKQLGQRTRFVLVDFTAEGIKTNSHRIPSFYWLTLYQYYNRICPF